MSPVHRNLNAPTPVRQARGRRLGMFRVLPLLVILLPLAAVTANAVERLPDELPADEVESFVAPLSDSDARQLLIERLRRDALSGEKVESAPFGDGRDVGERPNLFAASFENITQWAPQLPRALAQVIADAPAQAMLSQLGPSLRVMLVAVAVAALVEWLFRRTFHQLRRHMHNVRPTRAHTRFGFASMRLLLDGSSLGLFAGVAFLLVYWLTTESVAARMLVEHALSAVVLIRGLSILARFLLSPRAQGLRLFEMPSNVASALYRILLGLGGFALTAGLAARLLHRLGLHESHYTMCLVVIGSLVFLGLIALVWYVRVPVASAIGGGPLSSLDDTHENVNLLAHTWHVLACAFLLLTGALWSATILIGRPMEAAAALSSLLIYCVNSGHRACSTRSARLDYQSTCAV